MTASEPGAADTAAPVIAGLGLVGAMVALAMARGRGSRGQGILRAALVVFAWSVAVALLLVIPDRRVLMAVAYAPIFLIAAPFGWPPVSYFEVAMLWSGATPPPEIAYRCRPLTRGLGSTILVSA